MEYGGPAVELKPQDLVVLYEQVAQASQAWTYFPVTTWRTSSMSSKDGWSPVNADVVYANRKRAMASDVFDTYPLSWKTQRPGALQ